MSESEIRIVFAKNLKRLMRESGRTQTELSKYMGCSSSTASDWCNGRKVPRMDKIDMMTEFFRCNRSDLLMEPVQKSGDNYQLVAIPDTITAEEMDFLKSFRKLSEDDQAFIMATIKRLQK